MNAFVAVVVMLALLTGCRAPPAGAPRDLGQGYRREGHPAFTSQEEAAITAARRCLEQSQRRSIDAYYCVRHEGNGYAVFVLSVYRYEGSLPKFTIGRDWTVELGEDLRVKRVIQGK